MDAFGARIDREKQRPGVETVTKSEAKLTLCAERAPADAMAKSKTGTFTLVERVDGPTATAGITQGTIDLGAYVDVGDQQALAIESVDFILQAYDVANDLYHGALQGAASGDTTWDFQLSDLNPGSAIVPADDNSLIASATLMFDDSNNTSSIGPDLYPDNFGKLDESRMVVNDQLYFVMDASTASVANFQWRATVRIRARIVKLSTKDWMAIAIQSTASDN